MAQVLRSLPLPDDPHFLNREDRFADAAVYRLTEELALVQSVDFFTPVVDDPYLFGQIAAANSLSDIYALGGRPPYGPQYCLLSLRRGLPGVAGGPGVHPPGGL